jgi:hypothetical protein
LLGATLSKRRPQRVGQSPAKGVCIRFFIHSVSGTKAGRVKTLKSTLGDLRITGSIKRLKQAEADLWAGNVDSAKALFIELKKKPAVNFCKYLEKHKARIINSDNLLNLQLIREVDIYNNND